MHRQGGKKSGHCRDRDLSNTVELRAKTCYRLPESTSQDEAREGSFPGGFRGSRFLPTPSFWTFRISNCQRINFYCFKSPSLQDFAVPAPGSCQNQPTLFSQCSRRSHALCGHERVVLCRFSWLWTRLASGFGNAPACMGECSAGPRALLVCGMLRVEVFNPAQLPRREEISCAVRQRLQLWGQLGLVSQPTVLQ